MNAKQKAVTSFRNNTNKDSIFYEITQKATDDEVLELINISLASSAFLRNSVSNLLFASLAVNENNYSEKIQTRLNDTHMHATSLSKIEKKMFVRLFLYGLTRKNVEEGKSEIFATLVRKEGFIVNHADREILKHLCQDSRYKACSRKFNTTEAKEKIKGFRREAWRTTESVLNKVYSVLTGASIRLGKTKK